MKFIIAFFMAWGNFITIPCPYKRWDNNLKNLMLAFLPSVGIVVGVLWMMLFWVLQYFNIPIMMSSVVMMFYIFYVCGFMHMDGFMDCNDAIMSRRDLAERQRILKDSTVGAFAVLTAIFLFLAWYGTLVSVFNVLEYSYLLIIPVTSRAVSGLSVLYYKPIGHSQYATDYKETSRWKYRLVVAVQLIIVIAVAVMISGEFAENIIIFAVMGVVAYISCYHARKQLGGMSGDIAGYMICLSEVAGIMTAAIIKYI